MSFVAGNQIIGIGFFCAFQELIILRVCFDNIDFDGWRHPIPDIFDAREESLYAFLVKLLEFRSLQNASVFGEDRLAQADCFSPEQDHGYDLRRFIAGRQQCRNNHVCIKDDFRQTLILLVD